MKNTLWWLGSLCQTAHFLGRTVFKLESRAIPNISTSCWAEYSNLTFVLDLFLRHCLPYNIRHIPLLLVFFLLLFSSSSFTSFQSAYVAWWNSISYLRCASSFLHPKSRTDLKLKLLLTKGNTHRSLFSKFKLFHCKKYRLRAGRNIYIFSLKNRLSHIFGDANACEFALILPNNRLEPP